MVLLPNAKKIQTTTNKRVDFFGRALDSSQNNASVDEPIEEMEKRNKQSSNKVLFRFNEGYSDAVRKNVTMRDIFNI